MIATADPPSRADPIPASLGVSGPTEGVITVRMTGDLDPAVAAQLRTVFEQVTCMVAPMILVDLAEVSFLALEGVEPLLALTSRCVQDHRELRIVSSPAVRRKLTLLGLDTIIPIVSVPWIRQGACTRCEPKVPAGTEWRSGSESCEG